MVTIKGRGSDEMENRGGGLKTATTHRFLQKARSRKKVNSHFQCVFLIGISCAASSSFSIPSQSPHSFAHNIFAVMLIPL